MKASLDPRESTVFFEVSGTLLWRRYRGKNVFREG